MEGVEGEWKREKKTPDFHSMAMTFWGWQTVQMGHQLRKPISCRWPCWPQNCQVFGAHISPQDSFYHILFLGLRRTAPNRLPCQVRAVRELHF